MEKKVEYHINRQMMYSTDYVKEYIEVDKFDSLKTARKYLKEMLHIFDNSVGVMGDAFRRRNSEVQRVVTKYGQEWGDDYLGIENKITKVTTTTTKRELKGV